MKRQEVVSQITEAVHNTPNLKVIMYGSEARGDARADSDIDLLILVDSDKLSYRDKERIIAPLYEIELKSNTIISSVIMRRKEWEDRPVKSQFYYNVMKDGIIL